MAGLRPEVSLTQSYASRGILQEIDSSNTCQAGTVKVMHPGVVHVDISTKSNIAHSARLFAI